MSGITVGDFESIITVDPTTSVIKQAALETSMVLDKENRNGLGDFRLAAGLSLSFIHEVTGKTTKSKAGCLLAVDPVRWSLASDVASAAMIDPCGLHGHIILFLKSGTPYVLADRNHPGQIVSVSKEGKPSIVQMNRASLLRSALTSPRASISRPARCLVAAQ